MLQNWKNKFTKTNSKKIANLTNKEYEQLGRSVWQVYLVGYTSKTRLMYVSFLRGIAYGVGIFVGGTIVVSIIFATLLQFEELPIVGPLVQKFNKSIESSQQTQIKPN